MSLSLRPILSALLRNRTGPLLVALQITLALTVLVNGLYIVHQHLQKMSRPTLIDEDNLFGLYSAAYTQHFDYEATLHEDLAYLRGLPGVIDAAPTNALPLMIGGARIDSLTTGPHNQGRSADTSVYQMDEHGVHTLGVQLLAGRNFAANDVAAAGTHLYLPSQLIVTQDVANKLFPHENALGRSVYSGNETGTIVGIAADMVGSGWNDQPVAVAIYAQLPQRRGYGYLVRTAPGRRDALMRQVAQHLASSNQDRVIMRMRSIAANKQLFYATDRATGLFLVTVAALMVGVTCLGVFSLATFHVSTRTRQIGTRRAVGARRRDIVRYFLIENGLITTGGILAGCLLALAAGYWLSRAYSLPRLDLYYLVAGVLAMWLVGQLAAWWPARRAAAVPPSVATRTG